MTPKKASKPSTRAPRYTGFLIDEESQGTDYTGFLNDEDSQGTGKYHSAHSKLSQRGQHNLWTLPC